MRSFFAIGSNVSSILATLAVLILFGSFYFFIYVRNNESDLQMQRFRSLQNVERNIQAKIENTESVLDNILTAGSKPKDIARIKEFLRDYSSEKFEFTTLDTSNNGKDTAKYTEQFLIAIDLLKRQFRFTLKKQDSSKNQIAIGILYSFHQFIQPVLPPDIFDQYIVLHSGNILYESFPTGLGNTIDDSLSQAKSLHGSGNLQSIRIGGSDYKIFMQSVNYPGIDTSINVVGLLSEKRYFQERNSLPPRAIRILIVAGFAMIIAFPWLKLFHMGNKDRLTTADGIASIVVAMLLMSLLFFSFSAYNLRFRPSRSPDSKRTLAEKMSASFEAEVARYDSLLRLFNSSRKHYSLLAYNIKKEKDRSFKYYNNGTWANVPRDSSDCLNDLRRHSNIRQVFWLKNDGSEINSWSNIAVSVPLGNLKDREYFKRALSDSISENENTDNLIYPLDQIISWTRGSFANVISRSFSLPDNREKVVSAITFNGTSLKNVILPPGYSYAVINSTGKVLYHSNETRNLTENLVDELSEKNKLISNIEASTSATFNTKYFGKEYEVHFMPLKRLPYFILIFSDVSYKETRDMEIFFFSTSMLFSFFTLLLLQLIVVFILSSRKSILKKELADIGWIGPKRSLRNVYLQSVVAHIFCIVLLIFLFYYRTFLEYIFILLFVVTALGIFLNLLYARQYSLADQQTLSRSKKTVAVSLFITFLLINIAAFKVLDNPIHGFFIFEIIVGVVFAFLFYIRKVPLPIDVNSLSAKAKKLDYTKTFSLLAITRLIISSGIPVMFFYIHSYNFEQNLSIRYKHIQFADSLLNKYPDLEENTSQEGVYTDSSWIYRHNIVDKSDPSVDTTYSKEERHTINLLSLFRYYENDKAVKSAGFTIPVSNDSSFFFDHLLRAGKDGTGTVTYKRLPGQEEYLKIESHPLNYNLPAIGVLGGWDTFKGSIFWCIVIICLTLFFFLVHIIIRKLFALDLPDTSRWNEIDETMLVKNELNKSLFIIGSPGSGKLTKLLKMIEKMKIKDDNGNPLIHRYFSQKTNNVFVADLIRIPDSSDNDPASLDSWIKITERSLNHDYELIIVDHFEYNIKDQTTNHHKLNYLENLMVRKPDSKVIILSTIHPVTFLDSYHEEKRKDNTECVPEQDLERWHVLLGQFRIVIQPLQQYETINEPGELRRMLIQETARTEFLKNMQNVTLDIFDNIPINSRATQADSLVLKLQVTSHYFYMYIWQSLTKEEKFLLYDLAEDGLVNSFDDYNLSLLISKGVIIQTDSNLRLFNKGFRNFILTAIGNSEAIKIKNQIKDNGNWSKLKNPLMLLIVAIFTFLFTSQQETYSKLIVYVTAIGAAVPALLKIFSLFDKNTQKTG